jgi:hypothetical protein
MSRSATFMQREASMSYVSVAGGGLSDAMTTIWLDHQKFGPDAFKYTPDADGWCFVSNFRFESEAKACTPSIPRSGDWGAGTMPRTFL